MTIERQKEIAQLVMDKLNIIDPFCILAGGAPRDWYFGNEATDLDFFVYLGGNKSKRIVEKQIGALFSVESVKSGERLPENYKLNPHLMHVFQIGGYDIPVQVMVMRSPTFDSVVDYFPLSICKVWWKDGNMRLTNDFRNGIIGNSIFRTSVEYGQDHKYINKILAKFPKMRYYESELEMYRNKGR